MTEGRIPVNAEDIPTESVLLDESKVYNGVLLKCALAPKLDKKGNVFASILVEVAGGDNDGAVVDRNWIAIPENKYDTDSKAELNRKHNKGIDWGVFCRCFGITGEPEGGYPEGLDAEAFQNFQTWIEPFYGNRTKVGFTVQDNEFNGRTRSVIKQFLA